MATPHATLTHLAQQAAAQIGFTVRRWWRDTTDPAVLRVEVERRLVGACPAIAELTVAIPFASTSCPSPRLPRRLLHAHGRRRAAARVPPANDTRRGHKKSEHGRAAVIDVFPHGNVAPPDTPCS